MKKYLLILGLIFVGFTSNSQILISLLLGDKLNQEGLEFGLEGGINFTNVAGFEDTKMLGSFNLGFYLDKRIKNQWHVYTGVQVKSNFGMRDLSDSDLEYLEAEIEDEEGKYSQKMSAFMVPILANYKFKNHIYLEAGPQVGLVYKGWVEFTSTEDNRDIKIQDYNDNLLNWFNTGFAVGGGYKLMKGSGWTFGLRYYQGFTNVFKGRSGSIHNSLHLKANVPIGAGKKDKKE